MSWTFAEKRRTQRSSQADAPPGPPSTVATTTAIGADAAAEMRNLRRRMPIVEDRALNRLYCQAVKLQMEKCKTDHELGDASLATLAMLYERMAVLRKQATGNEMHTSYNVTRNLLNLLSKCAVRDIDTTVRAALPACHSALITRPRSAPTIFAAAHPSVCKSHRRNGALPYRGRLRSRQLRACAGARDARRVPRLRVLPQVDDAPPAPPKNHVRRRLDTRDTRPLRPRQLQRRGRANAQAAARGAGACAVRGAARRRHRSAAPASCARRRAATAAGVLPQRHTSLCRCVPRSVPLLALLSTLMQSYRVSQQRQRAPSRVRGSLIGRTVIIHHEFSDDHAVV